MNPDAGEVVWSKGLGRGGIIGGIHWGLSVNESLGLVFVPISDKQVMGFPTPGVPATGLYALDIETGEQLWHYSRESRCTHEECTCGLSSAITATNDIVVTGNMDGKLEIHSALTVELTWTHDSWQDYESTNGVPVTGGSFDAHGPMIGDDLLLVTSGYQYVGSQRGGNALLVLQLASVDE